MKHSVHKIKLDNGIRIIVEEDHSMPLVSLACYFSGGVRLENTLNSGISNFCQKMLIKGTKNKKASELANSLESLGARFSVFTEKDHFGVVLNILSRYFKEGLDIFCEILKHPAFEPEEVEKNKIDILSQIKSRTDDPFGYSLDICNSLLFQKHPYRLPVLGDLESIQKMNQNKLSSWHLENYIPSRSVVTLVGDIKTDYALKILESKFKARRRRPKAKIVSFSEAPLSGTRQMIVEREKKQVSICLGFFAPPINHPDFVKFNFLDYLLSGMGSRLFIRLRDKLGLGYVVNTIYEPNLDTGSFKVYIGTSLEQLEKSRKSILEELDKLKESPVLSEELKRTKRYTSGLHNIFLQRKTNRADSYSYYELMGLGWRFTEKLPELLNKVTSAQIMKVANKFLDTKNYVISILKPKKI